MSHEHGEKEKLKGTWDKVKGETKDTVGEITDNERLQAEGKWDKVKGEAKQSYGEAKEKASDFLNKD